MFIDANIFIMAVIGKDRESSRCREFLTRVETGEQHAVTSVLVMHEVLRSLERHMASRDEAAKRTARFVALPNLRVCDITSKDFSKSLEFFRQGLEPRDALHAAVALSNSVEKMLSFDKDFDVVKGIKRVEP